MRLDGAMTRNSSFGSYSSIYALFVHNLPIRAPKNPLRFFHLSTSIVILFLIVLSYPFFDINTHPVDTQFQHKKTLHPQWSEALVKFN